MFSANPYVAPQTLETAIEIRKLPMATLASSGALRKVLPAVSTVALARLVKQSRALEEMQLIWTWLTPLLLVLGFVPLLVIYCEAEVVPYEPLVIVLGCCMARLIGGKFRSPAGRYLSLLFDSLLVAVCVSAITWLTQRWFFGSLEEQIALVLCSAMLFFPVLFGFHSLVALLEARVLFGRKPCRHLELVEELDYRRELGIA